MTRTKKRKKSRKPRKNLNKKTLKKSKLQKGGIQFEIAQSQIEKLQHIGKRGTLGEEISCIPCALNQIGFPKSVVNFISRKINRDGQSIPIATQGVDIMNQLQAIYLPDAEPVKAYFWALESPASEKLSEDRISKGQLLFTDSPDPPNRLIVVSKDYMTSIKSFTDLKMIPIVLKSIFEIVSNRAATLLVFGYMHAHFGQQSHIVVIAKSNRGTPYLIETQSGPLQNIYRGMDEINNYFDTYPQILYFMTFNNSRPYYDINDGKWKLPNPDPPTIPLTSVPAELIDPANYKSENLENIDPQKDKPIHPKRISRSFQTHSDPSLYELLPPPEENAKLKDLKSITGLNQDQAARLLEAAGGNLEIAVQLHFGLPLTPI